MQGQLETFRREYPGIRVMQHDDCLVYTVTPKYSNVASIGANLLINRLGLNLVAIPSNILPKDTFEVKIIKNTDNEKERENQY